MRLFLQIFTLSVRGRFMIKDQSLPGEAIAAQPGFTAQGIKY